MSNQLFGTYITKRFTDVFESVDDFTGFLSNTNTGIPLKITTANATTLYYLLYARYGNNHIYNTDENQFKYKVASTIFMYGPTWEKKLAVQEALRGLNENDIVEGSTATYNSALNPGYLQDIDSQATQKINAQNKTIHKKTKMEGYANLLALLETDITKEFIDKFKGFFSTIVAPQDELTYTTTPEQQKILEI